MYLRLGLFTKSYVLLANNECPDSYQLVECGPNLVRQSASLHNEQSAANSNRNPLFASSSPPVFAAGVGVLWAFGESETVDNRLVPS